MAEMTQQAPNIISVIRMYRKERGSTFEEAKQTAVREFRKRGWKIPESIAILADRKEKESNG